MTTDLDLAKFGVQFLNAREMAEIDGGAIPAIVGFVVGAWLADSLFNYGSTVDNFRKGYESVRN